MENSIAVALEDMIQRLEYIENAVQKIQLQQLRQDARLDYLQNKMIAVHAAVDEKRALQDCDLETDYGFAQGRSL